MWRGGWLADGVFCMETVILEGEVRPLFESERRAMRRTIGRHRSRLDLLKRRILTGAVVLFAILWGVTLLLSHVPALVASAAWLVIGTVLSVWSYFSARTDLLRETARFEESLLRDEVKEVRVQSEEMVEFEEEEEEDEGASYAFQLNDGRIVFVCGQEYYPSARFPNTDFSLARIYDKNGVCVKELIHKRGRKLTPSRIVPAKIKGTLGFPENLEIIRGDSRNLRES